MKSKLNRYRKVANLPVKRVLKHMKMNEDEFYNLMETWIGQGIFTKNHPHFKELERIKSRKVNKKKYKLNEEHYLSYQYLRQEGHTDSEIAEILGRPEEKIEKFNNRWYKELRLKGLNDKEIKAETNLDDETLERLKISFNEDQKLKEKNTQKQIKSNADYAKYHLRQLKNEIEDPENYLIMDLEGIQNPDEILEIAVIDFHGNVLMNTLVRPTHHISYHVSQLTGINDRMASRGKGLYAAMRQLKEIVDGKTVLSWGTDYDQVLLNSAMRKTRIKLDCEFACAQHIHMGFVGSPNQIALYKACGELEQSHRALDDCEMVLSVLETDIADFNNIDSQQKDVNNE